MIKVKIGDSEVAVKGNLRGDLPVIFAVHGAGGGAWLFKDVRAELLDYADVLAIDLPGHGASTGAGLESVSAYTDVVREVARSVGVSRPYAMGHSMGGAISMTWAIKHPEELSGIILVSTGARLKVHPMVSKAIETDFASYVGMMKAMAFGPKTDEELVELSEEAMMNMQPEVALGDFRACDAFDVMNEIGGISIPALVLCGSDDKMTPPKYSEYLAGKIGGSTLKIFSGAGHMLPIERAEGVSDFIRRFIAKK